MESERRQYPRADLVFQIRYSPSGAQDEQPGTEDSISRDISVGGISIETKSELDPGKMIRLFFSFDELPGEIEATASVVRSWKQAGRNFAALRFTEIDSSDLEIIADYVNRYFAGPPEPESD